jgi:hypothetical protein
MSVKPWLSQIADGRFLNHQVSRNAVQLLHDDHSHIVRM